MNRTSHQQRCSGFTIIELMVVILLVGVVAALVLSGISRFREDVRTTQGLANLKEIHQTISRYTVDHKAELPIGFHTSDKSYLANPAEVLKPSDPDTEWSILLNDYMTGSGSTNAEVVMDINGVLVPQILPVFRDPNATFSDQGYLHYSAHPVLMPDTDHIYDINILWKRYKLTWLRRPSEVAMIMDGVQHPGAIVPFSARATTTRLDNILLDPSNQGIFPPYLFYNPSAGDNDALINAGSNEDTVANVGNIRWRQRGNTAANVMFSDGHSKTIGMADFKKRNIRVDPY